LASITTPTFQGPLKIGFVFFVPFSILLASSVGPSSAIAMLPRMVNTTTPDFFMSFLASVDDLYPMSYSKGGLTLNSTSDQSCECRSPELRIEIKLTRTFAEVNAGSSDQDWEALKNLPLLDVDLIQTGWQNVSVPIHGGGTIEQPGMPNIYSVDFQASWNWTNLQSSTSRRLYVQYAPNSTFATVQHYLDAYVLLSGGESSTGWLPDSPSYSIAHMNSPQPFTSVLCQLNAIFGENDTRPIQFPDRYVVGCGDPDVDSTCYLSNIVQSNPINVHYGLTNFTNITRADIWSQSQQDPQGRVIWIDDIPVSAPFTGSALGAIIIQPELCNDGSSQTFLSTSACVIGGTWANMTSFVQTNVATSDYIISDGVLQSDILSTTFSKTIDWSRQGVKLSKAWAESLNSVTEIQGRTVVDNLLRWTPLVHNICPTNGSYEFTEVEGSYVFIDTGDLTYHERPFMHEAILASLVANGMAYPLVLPQVYRYDYLASPGSSWEKITEDVFNRNFLANPPGPIIQIRSIIPGYAHGLSGIPVKIAISVLLVYCLLSLGFVFFTFITGQSELTWNSIAELTALAINSSPTAALKNTSAGISRVETFRRTVSVREVERHRRLELVFDQDQDSELHKRVVVGRGY
jgi:hypothetical protein